MTNSAEKILNAESAAEALVKELQRLKTAAESLEIAHDDSARSTKATQDVVAALRDVMPAVARVLEQLEALDLAAVADRLSGEIAVSNTELAQQLTGELQATLELFSQIATRLEGLPIGPKLEALEGRAELLLHKTEEATERSASASAGIRSALGRLDSLPSEIAAVRQIQSRVEQKSTENSQTTLAAIQSLTRQIGQLGDARSNDLRRLTWRLAGIVAVGLVLLGAFLYFMGPG